jgi:hypothetical protein
MPGSNGLGTLPTTDSRKMMKGPERNARKSRIRAGINDRLQLLTANFDRTADQGSVTKHQVFFAYEIHSTLLLQLELDLEPLARRTASFD